MTFCTLFLEHDKDRGTRQKIDEPPTPYSYYPYEGMFALRAALSELGIHFSCLVKEIQELDRNCDVA
jgi:hypothetical protein